MMASVASSSRSARSRSRSSKLLAAGHIKESADSAAHCAGGIAERAGAGQHIRGDPPFVTNLQLHAAELLAAGRGSLERELFRSQLLGILIEAKREACSILLYSARGCLRPRVPNI